MTDLTLIERAVESSPVIVVILLAACLMLWRKLNEEVASCRALHAQSIQTQQQLTAAINRLAERIEGAR
jgi:hypothetical protein